MGRAAEGSVSFGIDHQVKNEKVEPFLGFNVRGSRFPASGIHGCNANDFRRLASDAGGTLDDDAPAAHGSESRDDRELLTSVRDLLASVRVFCAVHTCAFVNAKIVTLGVAGAAASRLELAVALFWEEA